MLTTEERQRHPLLARLHLDGPLLLALMALSVIGLFVVYSAGAENQDLVFRHGARIGISFVVLFVLAQISPDVYRRWTVPVFLVGLALLVGVLWVGETGKGAQRWLNLGVVRIQPSELLKLAVPLMLAWYASRVTVPLSFTQVVAGLLLIALPTVLIALQPDLGTAILVACSGLFALFLAGMNWRVMLSGLVLLAASFPVLWFFFLQEYQRRRVMTFLNPESDPLGAGYHIMQSKIAIGSGGLEGKGYLQGTQSQLEFLPERHTDFIFAVFSEEFGLVGAVVLLLLFGFIIFRGMTLAMQAQSVFARILAGSITLTIFVYVFVNIGMVSGILPVVGVPLPLISYGGTSMVTVMAGFGMIMAIATHRRLVA